MSALAFRTGSFVSAGNASGGNLTLTKPTGTVDGDRVVIVVYFEPDTTTITVSPGTWESVPIANTGAFKLQVFSKIASSEPTSYTISNSTAGNQWRTAVGAAYQNGTGSGTLIDISGTNQGDAQVITNQTAPSVTTTDVDRMALFGYGNFSGNNVTATTGFCTNLRGSLGSCTLADALKTAAGATGTSRPSSGPGSEDFAAAHVAIISDIGGGTQNVSPDFINQAPQIFSPTITTGSVTFTPGLIDQAPTVYSPQLNLRVALGFIDQTPQTFAPTITVGSVTITPGLIDQAPTVYNPTVTPGSVTVIPGFIDQAPQVYNPQINLQIRPGFVDQTPTVYAPTVTPGSVTVTPGLIDQTPIVYNPTVTLSGGTQNIALGFIDQAPAVYAPQVNLNITPGFIDQTPQVFSVMVTPGSVTVTPGLIDQTAQIFSPTITTRAVTITPGLIDQTPVVYTITITSGAPPGTVRTGGVRVLDRTPYDIVVATSQSHNVILLDRTPYEVVLLDKDAA